jgi:class 3 adenylate cyclase
MQLRTRIFLSVGGFFVATMVVVTVVRLWEMKENLKVAKEQVEKGIEEIDEGKKEDVLNFLGLAIIEVETRINSLFHKIRQYDWLKQKYIPNQLNYETSSWSNSSVLLVSNQWLDFIQTTNQGKLTSRIEARPPFLAEFRRVEAYGMNMIIPNDFNSTTVAYIGVPYWSNEEAEKIEVGLHESELTMDKDRNYWLLFTVDQLLATDATKLHKWDGAWLPVGPSEPLIALHGEQVFDNLIQNTIALIKATQRKLQAHPALIDILKSPQATKGWLQELGVPLSWERQSPIDVCGSYLCEMFKNDKRQWIRVNEWAERYDQNMLIWQIATITGSGLWQFDPLGELAPMGIASFPRGESFLGHGLFSSDVFFDDIVPVAYNCSMEKSADSIDTCVSKNLQIYVPNRLSAAYLVNTLAFSDSRANLGSPATGTLSVGVDIIPVLKQLALASAYDVLFVSPDGRFLYIDRGGIVGYTNKWNPNDIANLSKKEKGIIRDANGEEYLFLHITKLVAEGGDVYVVELRDSGLKMEEKLNSVASMLSHQITIQQIIITIICVALTLLIQDRIIRRITNPLRNLALGIGKVATRRYEEIVIPEEKGDTKDEISLLVESFAQMVKDLKQGEQIRGILDKVVSKEIAEKIIREGVQLGGEIREVTVLFSDIRGFTHITQNMDPQDVLDMLNDCLTILTKAIDDFEGVIDKYVGDEVMALFGAPVETKHSALSAVQCAKSMREVMREWNRQRKESGKIPLEIGIGIHTGKMIAGNVGAESHPSYTVLGHNVNLASRLCGQAAPMEILITEEVLNAPQVRENVQVEAIPPLTLKGITEPVKAYRVL